MENYTMAIFEKQFENCKAQLREIGFGSELDRKSYQLYFMDKLRILGQCRRFSVNTYGIYMNLNYANLVTEKDVVDTVMHELIHSLDDCMKHTGRWKAVASMVNNRFGYSIARTSSTEEYGAYISNIKTTAPHYEIKCECCGVVAIYQKRTKTVTNISNHIGKYTCNKCHTINSFTVTHIE